MAAIHRRRRRAELNSQASTQGSNTLRLTYPHSHRGAIIKLPACLTLLTLETYNLCIIASKLLTVADMMAV